MNALMESLLEVTEREPLPEPHTSSHWKRYGAQTVAERREGRIFLRASGFSGHSRTSAAGSFFCYLERVCYGPLTARLKSWQAVWMETKRFARVLGISLTRHEWTCAVVMAMLRDHFQEQRLSPTRFAMIGDGDGFLGALLLRCLPDSPLTLFSIELPKALVFQAWTYQTAFPETPIRALLPAGPPAQAPGGTGAGREVILVHPDCLESVPGPIDCAVNMVSMQEMRPASVRAYFDFLRRRGGPQSRFYCVNKLRNRLPGGETSNFMEYPWQDSDDLFLDRECPYLRFFIDFSVYPTGPRLWGLRIPWVHYFEGVHQERLVRLAPLSSSHDARV